MTVGVRLPFLKLFWKSPCLGVDLTGDGVLELTLVVLADDGLFGEAERGRCAERGVAILSDTTESS